MISPDHVDAAIRFLDVRETELGEGSWRR